MVVIILALIAGLVGGLLAGLVVGWLVVRRARRSSLLEPIPLDPAVEHSITQAASAWAAARGQPEAAGVIAGKLRLLYRWRGRGWSV